MAILNQPQEECFSELAYRAELKRRTDFIVDRDSVSASVASSNARQWLDSEIAMKRLDESSKTESVYLVYYRRYGDDITSDYQLAEARYEGLLYSWPVTHNLLADLIRTTFDSDCEFVVTFHKSTTT